MQKLKNDGTLSAIQKVDTVEWINYGPFSN